jgi:hypothetical protein
MCAIRHQERREVPEQCIGPSLHDKHEPVGCSRERRRILKVLPEVEHRLATPANVRLTWPASFWRTAPAPSQVIRKS